MKTSDEFVIRVEMRLQKGVHPVVGDSTIACDFSDSDLKPIYYLIESAARRLLTPDSLRESLATMGNFPTMI